MESMVEPKKIAVNFEPALLAALDEHRRQLPDLPTRSEAIRRAVEAVALNGASTRKPRGKARKQRSKS
jgi:metal-responsive CopG/Arc/MetJ family transcriptional regulator